MLAPTRCQGRVYERTCKLGELPCVQCISIISSRSYFVIVRFSDCTEQQPIGLQQDIDASGPCGEGDTRSGSAGERHLSSTHVSSAAWFFSGMYSSGCKRGYSNHGRAW